MKNVHILLVEDNEGDILLTQEAFENANENNKLSVVRDGEEAIDFLKKQGNYSNIILPDLLLLDINLPKKSGIEVLKFIKEDEKLLHIPVIMLSTSSSENDINVCYQNHVNCYITKPLNVDTLFGVFSSIENFWLSIATLPSKNI